MCSILRKVIRIVIPCRLLPCKVIAVAGPDGELVNVCSYDKAKQWSPQKALALIRTVDKAQEKFNK